MRERLIELIQSVPVDYDGYVGVDRVVDHLIANGVIVPLCNVGDNLWFETWKNNATVCVGIQPHKVDRIDVTYVCDSDKLIENKVNSWEIGKRVFLTKEDCERAVDNNEG